jgi:hypothetical protein
VALEIKATKKNTIPASALLPHQKQALIAVQTPQGLTHKLSDIGRIRQPFDAFQFRNAKSFIIVCFLTQKVYLAIDPKKWNGANPNTPAVFKIKL